MSETNKNKKIIQGLALALFLIGLPIGSWYYLSAGFGYHTDLMSELKDYGRMPEFKLVDQFGDTLNREDIEGKTAVVAFINPENDTYSKTMEYLRKYQSQFHDRKDLLFVTHSLKPMSAGSLKDIAAKEEINSNQNILLSGSETEMKKVLLKGYQVPDLTKRQEDKTIPFTKGNLNIPIEYPYLILVNDSGMIRNYYDVRNDKSLTRLIEHLALTLPRKAEEEAVKKMETEK